MKTLVWIVRLVATILLVVAMKHIWLRMLETSTVEQLVKVTIRSASLTLLAAIGVELLMFASNRIAIARSKSSTDVLDADLQAFQNQVYSNVNMHPKAIKIFTLITWFLVASFVGLVIYQLPHPTVVGHMFAELIQSTITAVSFYVTRLLLDKASSILQDTQDVLDDSNL